jgi:hypothetical protein
MCRDILTSIDDYISDVHLVYMICETYLQEHVYDESAKLLERHLEVRSEAVQEQEVLPA